MIFHTFTADETEALGRKLAEHLEPNSIIALNGVLGAGKTVLTRGIARGLGIDGIIKSPTFTIICEYEGRLPLYHMDMYRISSDDEFEMTGGKSCLHQVVYALLSGAGISGAACRKISSILQLR